MYILKTMHQWLLSRHFVLRLFMATFIVILTITYYQTGEHLLPALAKITDPFFASIEPGPFPEQLTLLGVLQFVWERIFYYIIIVMDAVLMLPLTVGPAFFTFYYVPRVFLHELVEIFSGGDEEAA